MLFIIVFLPLRVNRTILVAKPVSLFYVEGRRITKTMANRDKKPKEDQNSLEENLEETKINGTPGCCSGACEGNTCGLDFDDEIDVPS